MRVILTAGTMKDRVMNQVILETHLEDDDKDMGHYRLALSGPTTDEAEFPDCIRLIREWADRMEQAYNLRDELHHVDAASEDEITDHTV